MSVPQSLGESFQYALPYLERLERLVRETFERFCRTSHYAFVSRVKDELSVLDKIESGRYEKFLELDDLVACAVIIPTVLDETSVVDFCSQHFEIVARRGRGISNKAPEVFRFDLPRLVCRLRPLGLADPRVDIVYRISFEVQVRTAFEHAWQVSMHSLAYKSEQFSWKRERLSAQLKAAVETLDSLILAFERLHAEVPESPDWHVEAITAVCDWLASRLKAGRLPAELGPPSLSRFARNVVGVLGDRASVADVQRALAALDEWLEATGPTRIPRSLSLHQIVLGVLMTRSIVPMHVIRKRFWHLNDNYRGIFGDPPNNARIFKYGFE